MSIIKKTTFSILLVMLLSANSVYAQSEGGILLSRDRIRCRYPNVDLWFINTAIGCFNTQNFDSFTYEILPLVVSLGGGFALLLSAYGGFIVITSQGDMKKMISGKDTITAALIGLLFLIFSVMIIRIIGVDILGIIEPLGEGGGGECTLWPLCI